MYIDIYNKLFFNSIIENIEKIETDFYSLIICFEILRNSFIQIYNQGSKKIHIKDIIKNFKNQIEQLIKESKQIRIKLERDSTEGLFFQKNQKSTYFNPDRSLKLWENISLELLKFFINLTQENLIEKFEPDYQKNFNKYILDNFDNFKIIQLSNLIENIFLQLDYNKILNHDSDIGKKYARLKNKKLNDFLLLLNKKNSRKLENPFDKKLKLFIKTQNEELDQNTFEFFFNLDLNPRVSIYDILYSRVDLKSGSYFRINLIRKEFNPKRNLGTRFGFWYKNPILYFPLLYHLKKFNLEFDQFTKDIFLDWNGLIFVNRDLFKTLDQIKVKILLIKLLKKTNLDQEFINSYIHLYRLINFNKISDFSRKDFLKILEIPNHSIKEHFIKFEELEHFLILE